MSTEPFGLPAIDVVEDPTVQHIDLRSTPRTSRKAPPRPTSEPPRERGDVEDEPVVLGARTWAWLAGQLRTRLAQVAARFATQLWVCEPQPSLRRLLEHAQAGDWTTKNRHRAWRVGWLYLPAALPRLAANTALRVLVPGSPGVLADQPPIAEVLGGDVGAARRVGLWVLYLPLRLASVVADFAYRTGVVLLVALLTVNALGAPAVLTAAYWWQVIARAVADATHTTTSVASDAAPLLGKVAGTALLTIAALWVLRNWWNNRDNGGQS